MRLSLHSHFQVAQTITLKKKLVKVIETGDAGWFNYQIIEIYGVQYVATARGGIYPLVRQNTDNTVFKENIGSIRYTTKDLP